MGAPLDFESRGGTFKFWLWGVEIETESLLRDPIMTGTWGAQNCSPDAMMSRDVRNAATRKNSSHFRVQRRA